MKKYLSLIIRFSTKNLKTIYSKKYFKNKRDLTVVANFVPQNNLFKTRISFINPVMIMRIKNEIISLSTK